MTDRLVAWLYDTPVATLMRGPEFRIRLEWRPEGIERWGLGSPALSVGLPIGAPTGPRDMRGLDFLENILPEGPALERMAVLAGVRPVDTYGILAAFGHDCAGAIMVLPDEDRPGGSDADGYSPMAPGDLERVISALDATPLAAAPERGFRPSLAGFQRKALVGRADDGTWQLPSGDAPSTWILKPDGPHAIAANEATCLWLAAACGLPVPEAELLDVAGIPVLAVKRYDRQDASAGDIPARVHQEDGCQATAMPPRLKYEEQGGPALRDFVSVIRNFGDPRDVTGLLRRTTFNMAVGNADAHAKNFSILSRRRQLGRQARPALRRALDHRPGANRQRGAANAGRHAPRPACRRASRHPQRDRGQPDRRSSDLGCPAAHGFGGGYRDNGPSARSYPSDARRCPGSRRHP